jgi:hypothetical protein
VAMKRQARLNESRVARAAALARQLRLMLRPPGAASGPVGP